MELYEVVTIINITTDRCLNVTRFILILLYHTSYIQHYHNLAPDRCTVSLFRWTFFCNISG